jgi:hypothetical protein
MRIVLMSLLLCCSAVAAHGQQPRVDRIEVAEYGLYQMETIETAAAPDVPGGSLEIVNKARNVGVTRTIPAQLGVEFGFQYRLIGEPKGADVPLVFRTRFPQPGLVDPSSGKTYSRSEDVRRITIGPPSYNAYGFGEAWELVPGVWTLEIWYEDRKLAEQTFMVVKPYQRAGGD